MAANVGGVSVLILITLAIVILAQAVLSLTPFGSWIRGVGSNESAVRTVGLPSGRIKIAVFVVSGVLAALSEQVDVRDPADRGEVAELLADEHERPLRTSTRDVREQLEVHPALQRAVEADPRPRQRRQIVRHARGVVERAREQCVIDPMR